jgi:hypothetical protein
MFKTLAGLLVVAVGCGGGSAEGPATNTGGTADAAKSGGGAADASFDVGPIPIAGLLFEPEALGRPGMPMVDAKQKTTIEKQRKVVADAKDPVVKQAQAAVLATMIYRKAKDLKGDEQAAMLKDARQALIDSESGLKPTDKPDEITLRLTATRT